MPCIQPIRVNKTTPIKYDPQIISQEPDSGIYALLRQAVMAGLFRGFCERIDRLKI